MHSSGTSPYSHQSFTTSPFQAQFPMVGPFFGLSVVFSLKRPSNWYFWYFPGEFFRSGFIAASSRLFPILTERKHTASS